jgi:farnesyl diphosphate synthase
MQTVRGQCLDMITAPSGGKMDFTDFTEDRYNTIVKWKTGYYSFYLPVAIAMYMVWHRKSKILSLLLCENSSVE